MNNLNNNRDNEERITYANSLIATESIQTLVMNYYIAGQNIGVEFLQAGVNDTYLVSTETGKRWIYRIYRANLRTREAIEDELLFLEFLAENSARVAKPVRNVSGEYINSFMAPEGERFGVLFEYADGQLIDYGEDGCQHAGIYGQELARIHSLQEKFVSNNTRPTIDFNELFEKPMAKIKLFFSSKPELLEKVVSIGDYIKCVYEESEKSNLRIGYCHGDTHCHNAHIDKEESITFFDFDCCGKGWLEYDLATYLWASVLEEKETRFGRFIEGYISELKHYQPDMKMISLLVAMRHLWLLGLHYDSSKIYGKNWYTSKYFEGNTEFLVNWKVEFEKRFSN